VLVLQGGLQSQRQTGGLGKRAGRDISGVSKDVVLADRTADGDGGSWLKTRRLALLARQALVTVHRSTEAKTRPRDLPCVESPLTRDSPSWTLLTGSWCGANARTCISKSQSCSSCCGVCTKIVRRGSDVDFSPLDSLIVWDSSRSRDVRRLLQRCRRCQVESSSSRYHRTALQGTGELGVHISSCSTA